MVSDRHQLRILKRASRGDAEAFVGLSNRYSEALYRYLYFRLGSVFAAEEVSAQVFVRAWEALPSDPRQDVLPFAAWLFQVANEVVSERTERFNRLGIHPPRPPLVAWSGNSSDSAKAQLHPRFLAQAIMQLDEVAQQVILLRFVTRMSHRDIAMVIEDTGTGSRVLQYRALLDLREILTRKKMSENAYSSDYVGTATFCIDRIISAHWEADECLEHIPQHADSLQQLLAFAVMVRDASDIRPRRSLNDNLRKQLLVDIRQSKRRPVRQSRASRWFFSSSERVPMPLVASFALALILFVGVTGVTAMFMSVDRAVPGDRLYQLDLRLERAYRAFLSSPDSRTQFALDLTDERLAEAEKLAKQGDTSGLQVALVAYSLEVASLVNEGAANSVGGSGSDLDTHFSQQQQQLDRILVSALNASSAVTGNETPYVACDATFDQSASEATLHPVGLTLAAQHDVNYRDVMEWVCNGHSFGEIVLALASVDSTQIPTGEILLLKSQLGGWGQLWNEMASDEGVVPGDDEESPIGDTIDPLSTEEPEAITPATPSPIAPAGTPTPGDTQDAADGTRVFDAPDDPGPPDWVDPPGGGPPDDPGPPHDGDPPGDGPPNDPGPPDWVDPPGHDDNHGNSGNPPGQDDNPGNSGNPPGQDGNPGNSGNPPGQDGNPGNSGDRGNSGKP